MIFTCEQVARAGLGEPRKRPGVELLWRCPQHDDQHPSLGVNPTKNVWMCGPCGVGGTPWQLAAFLAKVSPDDKPAVKKWLADRGLLSKRSSSNGKRTGAGLTLARYAEAKRLPASFLESVGVKEIVYGKAPALEIPYHGTDGEFLARRFRLALAGEKRFLWETGTKVMPYGLWRLNQGDADYIVLVEGESDCHTLWHHGVPALGIPGVGTWCDEWASHLARFKRVYAVIEPGTGGQTLRTSLLKSPLRDRLEFITLDGYKDASALHCVDPESFPARWSAALSGAVPASECANVGAQVIPSECRATGGEDGERESGATKLIHLAEGMELFHEGMGDAYATVLVNGHRETTRIDSRACRRRLSFEFYTAEGKAPSPQALASALPTIEAKALFESVQREVHVRVAEHDGEIYIDLCNPNWEAVRVTKTNWAIVHDPAVRFVRRQGMLLLPTPEHGGSLDALRRLVNVEDADWPLFAGYLLGCLRERGPFPILVLLGESGSGKSTQTNLLKYVIDPSEAPLRGAPKDERDLLIAAQGAHVLSLDNASYLDEQLSDALCRLATGSGLATRTLYTDSDETIFRAARPVIINSISDVINRSDLLDRAIVLDVPPLKEKKTEEEYWVEVRKEHATILGCLCDAVSVALQETEGPDLTPDVRMLDFALFVMRGERALGLGRGSFVNAYASNRKSANESVVELSPVAQAVMRFAEGRKEWEGSFAELLALLTPAVSAETARSREWPKTARGLSGAVRRLVPNLRRVGIEVTFPGRVPHCGRSLVSVKKVGGEHSPPSPSQDLHPTFTPEPAEHARDKGRVNEVNVGEGSSASVNVGTAKVKIEDAHPESVSTFGWMSPFKDGRGNSESVAEGSLFTPPAGPEKEVDL